ncbi:MAG: helix-turn-helix domain-containing protein [Streptosporangiaceae bacterium]
MPDPGKLRVISLRVLNSPALELAQARKSRGLTQRDVATAMGLSVGRVSQIERGEVTSVEVLGRYADAVGGRLRVVIDFGDELIAV